ncbi:MAG: DNA glycosylase [Butyricicoccus sp.]
MIERVLNDFDIDQIANSGQCFRFHRVGDKSYNLIAGTHLLNIGRMADRTVRLR